MPITGTFNRYQIATGLAILFHLIGLLGILFGQRDFFIQTTPLNLLLMFGLLIYTAQPAGRGFYIFLGACFLVGMSVEWIGVHTGMLFGQYKYGKVLGPSVHDVPLMIGINWFIVMYGCGTMIHALFRAMLDSMADTAQNPRPVLKTLSVVVDGSMLAVAFDWLMEPVAVTLGYWTWLGDGEIPMFNYACWFAISLPLMFLFHHLPVGKTNKFAIHLLLIQAMFFLLLRTFL